MSKSLANSTQLTKLLNTINSKITHESWDTVIRQTNILIDGNPKTIIIQILIYYVLMNIMFVLIT